MTRITVSLPDDVVERARSAGLLSDAAIRQLLEDAMRRDAGRRLLQLAGDLHVADLLPMTDEEVVAEVHAVRAMRHAQRR